MKSPKTKLLGICSLVPKSKKTCLSFWVYSIFGIKWFSTMIWHISKVGLLANGYWSGLVLETAHTDPPTANSDDLKRRKFEIHLEKKNIQIHSCSDICPLASIIWLYHSLQMRKRFLGGQPLPLLLENNLICIKYDYKYISNIWPPHPTTKYDYHNHSNTLNEHHTTLRFTQTNIMACHI